MADRRALPFLALALVAAVLIGFYLPRGPSALGGQLDRSALGTRGFAALAADLGVTITEPSPFDAPKASDLSLRILPLYDLDLYAEAAAPKTREEQLGLSSLREIDAYTLREKLWELKTLVVLPKWRAGVVLTGVAHRDFLIGPDGFDTLFDQLALDGLAVQVGGDGFVSESVTLRQTSGEVTLFHPQTFVRSSIPKDCSEVAGLAAGALLITCSTYGGSIITGYLSDPDLISNHGLTLGGNAVVLAGLVASLQDRRETRPVYLDTSTEFLLAPEQDVREQNYERDSSTILRMFKWPLSLLWIAGLAVFGILLWRGLVRFGPVTDRPEDRLEVSKLAAIDAKARLIRMSRNDGQMVAEFIQARLQGIAEQTFGAGTHDPGHERLFARFRRRNAEAATALKAVCDQLTNTAAGMTLPDLRRNLDQFKVLLERLTDGTS